MAWSPEHYIAALQFAARAHRSQTFPGSDGLPYLVHLNMVCMEVMTALHAEPFARPDLAVQCALLHDTIEDTAVTHDELAAAFGTEVADGVRALSKDPSLPEHERMRDSLQRIRAQPREVWIVKLADRISNLQAPPAYWPRDKRARYRDEAGDILAALGEASAHLSARLRKKIAGYQEYIDSHLPT